MTSYPRSSESRMNSEAFRAGMTDGTSAFVPYGIQPHSSTIATNLHVSFTQKPTEPTEEKDVNIKKIKNILLENTNGRESIPPNFHSYISANVLQDVPPLAKKSEMIAEALPHSHKTPTEFTNSALVDKITMEYMMNKHHYKKYLSKTNNIKYEETKQQIQKVQKYQEYIAKIVQELIKDFIEYGSFTKYNTDINHFFESFMISSIRYLDENPHDYMVNDDDDDTMFAIIDDKRTVSSFR